MTASFTTHPRGVTFAVDDVVPTQKRLDECRAYEEVRRTLGGPIEGCSDYHAMVLARVGYQPLLAAVYLAFSEHRPLVLSPDSVWITIAQGVAHHMAIHGERLRPKLVAHEGKLDLKFRCMGWVKGSPENPWAEAFESWTGQIREHVGASLYDTLVCDFSTTGPAELAASRVVMMDVFEKYFRYKLCCVCGIPSVTLEGSPADWRRLREKAEGLRVFDMDWWLEHLLPICDQFVRASEGDVDLGHWRSICKLREAYGGDIINGWVAGLFPYIRSFFDGPCNEVNPIFETGKGFSTLSAPSGLSSVPFVWMDEQTGRSLLMEAVGGLIGVMQDAETLALRPMAGWAVREADAMDALLPRLERDHATFSPAKPISGESLPDDLDRFYNATDGADLFGQGEAAACRILPKSKCIPACLGPDPDEEAIRVILPSREWHRLATLPDGSWVALHPRPEDPRPLPDDWEERMRVAADRSRDSNFAAICHVPAGVSKPPADAPVIATSFGEFLGRTLDHGPDPYWLAPGFASYGQAHEYMRKPRRPAVE